ncbi:MAG: von Willebrand factor type A domain-containing protein, partial [Candidatus Eremiobacterota bacterium]
MRRLLLFLAVAGWLALSSAVARSEEPLITLSARDADLVWVLREVARQSGLELELTVPIQAKVSVNWTRAPLSRVLADLRLLSPSGVSLALEGKKLRVAQVPVSPRPAAQTEARKEKDGALYTVGLPDATGVATVTPGSDGLLLTGAGYVPGGASLETYREPSGEWNTEAYAHQDENPFLTPQNQPLSTFSIDVDTASYSNVRRMLADGQQPPKGAVRLEEMINYFTYDYPDPGGNAPFSVTTELSTCPWSAKHQLLAVGVQGRRMPAAQVPPRNLVFLVDVSGSMRP